MPKNNSFENKKPKTGESELEKIFSEIDKDNPLPFEIPSEDPVEKAKRILKESKGKNKDMKLASIKFLVKDIRGNLIFNDYFEGGFREHCLDFGIPITTNEMNRSFYLKHRISIPEKKNLLTILELLNKSKNHEKLSFKFGLFGVGSSTFSDEYYKQLREGFYRQGLTDDDFILEVAEVYGIQFKQFKNYEEFKEQITKENKSSSFDEQKPVFSKEFFDKQRLLEQEEYSVKKRVGDILNNKGEDLDFIILPDYKSRFNSNMNKYHIDRFDKFKSNIRMFSKEMNLDLKEETSYLGNHSYKDYRSVGGAFERVKEIQSRYKTIRITFSKGRSFHFYFKDYQGDAFLRQEIINGRYFAQLLRKNNIADLKSTINHGLKTGIYENPFLLKLFNRNKK